MVLAGGPYCDGSCKFVDANGDYVTTDLLVIFFFVLET